MRVTNDDMNVMIAAALQVQNDAKHVNYYDMNDAGVRHSWCRRGAS